MVYNTIFRCGIQRVIASWCVIVSQVLLYMHRNIEISIDRCNHVSNYDITLPMWGSGVAYFKTEIPLVYYKNNKK